MLRQKIEIIKEFYDPSVIGIATGGVTITSKKFYPEGKQVIDFLSSMQGEVSVWNPEHISISGIIHGIDDNAPGICFEISIPDGWNGKLVQLGGGCFCGFVLPTNSYAHGETEDDPTLLAQGYAVCTCDSGHSLKLGDSPWSSEWALNEEALKNFAYEQIKKTKDIAVYLVEEVMGSLPERVYYFGSSEGGKEVLQAVQRYPEDYDGVICLYPVLNWVMKAVRDSKIANILTKDGGQAWLSEEECNYVKRVVMECCDGLDGVKDGIISNWQGALEQWEEILHRLEKRLTDKQIEGLKALAEPMHFPYPLANGWQEAPGYIAPCGGALNIIYQTTQTARDGQMMQFGDAVVKYQVVKDNDFDPKDFRPEEWREKLLEASNLLDATNPDLSAFYERGGKMLLLHGLADEVVTPLGTIAYYDSLVKFFGDKINDFVRFYLIPGYGHGGGDFTAGCNFLSVLDEWVENGKRPEELILKDINPSTAGRTRPVYPYPDYPVYVGKGDINRAENYVSSRSHLQE